MKSGKPGFDAAFGMPLFSYLEKNAQTAAIFNDAMLATSRTRFREFAARFPLGRARTLVDIGGGTGAFLEATLSAHPKLNGVLFDRPAVIAQALRRMNPLLAKRCRFISGDFFRALPELSADVYVLRNILHDWNDQRALRILRNCRARMTPKSKLLILEILLTARPSAVQAFEDLQMLILTGGKERTRSQYAALLCSSGFRIRRVVRIGFPQNVIEAVPV